MTKNELMLANELLKAELVNANARIRKLHIIISNRYSAKPGTVAESGGRAAKIAASLERRAALHARAEEHA